MAAVTGDEKKRLLPFCGANYGSYHGFLRNCCWMTKSNMNYYVIITSHMVHVVQPGHDLEHVGELYFLDIRNGQEEEKEKLLMISGEGFSLNIKLHSANDPMKRIFSRNWWMGASLGGHVTLGPKVGLNPSQAFTLGYYANTWKLGGNAYTDIPKYEHWSLANQRAVIDLSEVPLYQTSKWQWDYDVCGLTRVLEHWPYMLIFAASNRKKSTLLADSAVLLRRSLIVAIILRNVDATSGGQVWHDELLELNVKGLKRNLCYIDFSGNRLTDAALLTKGLQFLDANFRSLVLEWMWMTGAALPGLFDSFVIKETTFRSMEELCLVGNRMGQEACKGLKKWMNGFRDQKNVCCLRIFTFGPCVDPAMVLDLLVKYAVRLERLHVHESELSDSGCASLNDIVKKCPNFQNLNISACAIHGRQFKKLLAGIQARKDDKGMELNMVGIKLSKRKFAVLDKWLRGEGARKLRGLSLDGQELSGPELQHLHAVSPMMSKLEKLEIDGIPVRAAQTLSGYFTKFITGLHGLKHLTIRGYVRNDGAVMFEQLGAELSLHHLVFYGNPVGHNGLMAIAKFVQTCTTLKSISCDQNSVMTVEPLIEYLSACIASKSLMSVTIPKEDISALILIQRPGAKTMRMIHDRCAELNMALMERRQEAKVAMDISFCESPMLSTLVAECGYSYRQAVLSNSLRRWSLVTSVWGIDLPFDCDNMPTESGPMVLEEKCRRCALSKPRRQIELSDGSVEEKVTVVRPKVKTSDDQPRAHTPTTEDVQMKSDISRSDISPLPAPLHVPVHAMEALTASYGPTTPPAVIRAKEVKETLPVAPPIPVPVYKNAVQDESDGSLSLGDDESSATRFVEPSVMAYPRSVTCQIEPVDASWRLVVSSDSDDDYSDNFDVTAVSRVPVSIIPI